MQERLGVGALDKGGGGGALDEGIAHDISRVKKYVPDKSCQRLVGSSIFAGRSLKVRPL